MKSSFSFNSLLAVGFLTCVSIAQVPPQTPTEFKTLKTRYKSDVQTALQPLRVRYIAALEALLRSTTKSGDLDAALAVQRELDLTKGKNSAASGGKVTLELKTLTARYEADVQTSFAPIQTRYATALEALQTSLTKRGDLAAAQAVRQELSVVTPQGSAGGVAAIRATPEGRLPAVDPIQPNSVWLGQPPWSTFIFTIKERRGETFKGRFETASGSYIRDVTGTVKDGKISWLSKDVRAIKGGVGGDNEGTIDGDKIDFIVRGSEAERSGRWSVRLKPPARE